MLGKRVYKVFISSTYEDLKNERQKVIEAIIRMHLSFSSVHDKYTTEIVG